GEVAEELTEAMQGRQEFVQVARVILAKRASGIALRLQRSGKRASFHRDPDVGPGLAYGRQARADGKLAGDEIRPPRRAACFGVIVGKSYTLRRELIQVRCLSGHDPLVISADVEPANVVSHDEWDVRFFVLRLG